jgi:hypothetical protein
VDIVRSQAEELLADALAARLFGVGYLYAFFVFSADNGSGAIPRRVEAWSPNKEMADHEKDNVRRWIAGGEHPPSALRAMIIAQMLGKSGDLKALSVQSFMAHLRSGTWWTGWHDVLEQRMVTPETLANRLMMIVEERWPRASMTHDLYRQCRESIDCPWKDQATDARVIPIAAAMRRLTPGLAEATVGSFVPSALRSLSAMSVRGVKNA